jgi:hypothetical protein
MNDYFQYIPCPGEPGGPFYSNVGPAWTQSGGPFFNFTVSPNIEKIPIGVCYRLTIVTLANLPSTYIQIDWNTAVGYSSPDCETCKNFPPNEPCLNCPPGYILQEGDCIQEQSLPATYTGGLLQVRAGARSSGYNNFGLRLYPDISGYTFPLYGTGTTLVNYQVEDNNGAGVLVAPLLGAWGSPLLSTLWGSYSTGNGCLESGQTGGRLNIAGVWVGTPVGNDYPPYDTPICFEFCVDITTPKQYLIGISGDNKVEISINGVQTVFLDAPINTSTAPFSYWHVFPITLNAGQTTIKLCGINIQDEAAFAAEVYDIDLATFQADLTTPATSPPNCGNVPLDLEPYIVFSTRDYINQFIADPDNPGDWSCPPGSILDECNGVPQCIYTVSVPPLPCGYEFVPCCGGDPEYYQIAENTPLTEGAVYVYSGTLQCYTVSAYTGPALSLPFPVISISELSEVAGGCEDDLCLAICEPCICRRYRWTGTPSVGTYEISYLDCNLAVQTIDIPMDGVTWTEKVCAKVTLTECINVSICWEEEQYGDCLLKASQQYECPPCFILEDCDGIKDPIYTLNPIIQTYIDNNQVIRIDGSDTCWRPSVSDDDCNCAVDVSVQFVYANCPECKTAKGYKLTECNTGDVIYTTTDLSAYTSVTIEIDCPGCWTVEQLDILPPTSQPVTVLTSYGDCPACYATYYELVDCAGIKDTIYTSTDLSDYIGQVVQIRFCPETCWTVALAEQPVDPGDVYVDQSFFKCDECLIALLTCSCKTITYTGGHLRAEISYIDCTGDTVLVTLQSGESVTKTCMLQVNTDPNVEITVVDYGACIDGECPPPGPIGPLRKVRPGYNTAACTTEYYEKVVCNYSEWVYKDVLKRRYGISSCCDEELLNWEIKYEMLMLDVLVNPDYTCATTNTCNCPSTCGCNCVSSGTCSS